MTNEERDMISQFIGRVGGTPAVAQPSQFGGSVPATTQPALPPMDPDANALIGQAFQQHPEAAYRMTQLAFVQEHALAEAQTRLKRLEWELQQAQQAAEQAAQQAARPAPQPQAGGFFGGLFGGRSQAPPQPQPGPGPAWNQGGPPPGYPPQYQQAAPPPPPQYPPNYQPGMFQRSGSGFLGSALTTAAGVGGGMLAANALMDLFSGHHGVGGGGFGGSGFGGGYPAAAPMVESPWGGAASAGGGVPQGQDYVDQGSWDNASGAAPSNQDNVDSGTWDQPADNSDQPADNSGGGDAGWDAGDAGGGDSGGGGSDSLC
ncbi:MAG TPA: DUF2076 family protein [Acetobacteraceae bacterium]|nr:DUF2076 family protein [Acetobacteraceae bacterium]